MNNDSAKLTGPMNTMLVAEAYRTHVTHVVCRDHYFGRKALAADAPVLGTVQDARRRGICEFCSAITINVYRSGGSWFGARWIGGEYDGCDELPCDDDASESEAIRCAETMALRVDGPREIKRVADQA